MCMFSSDLLFIHIPKTGGNSVKTMLEIAYREKQRSIFTLNERFDNPHILLNQVPFDIGSRFTFCVVRNPWEQRVSFYLYNLRKNQIPNIPFKKYLLEHRPNFSISKYLQSDKFDRVYQIEHFDEMMSDLEQRFDIKFKEEKHMAKAPSYNYKDFYDPYLVKLVEDKERYLLERFNYESIC